MDKKISLITKKTLFHSRLPLKYDMIVFCHLRWNFVYQRPQHIISRLSQHFNILVVEEPIATDNDGDYELQVISENLTILRPKVERIADIHIILEQLNLQNIDIAWFYSAAFVELIPYMKINTMIYDCMDELSQFKGASQQLRAQEEFLIKEADLIFTGGKSLYEAKSKLSSNVHCFPSSVDVAHFKKGSNGADIPLDIVEIPEPIIGYIGVIDERINLNLIHETARALPEISFVMIGPLAKIDDRDLPREHNIYYLGMKSYNELPHYLERIKISMMPFALNEATEFISPTKTLEYMAAGKPIISTAIKDVTRDYSHIIDIVNDSTEFENAINNILSHDKTLDSVKYQEILTRTSWDATTEKMLHLITELV
jgi:glycosyltransferase involved in cell wall biosynthesis